MENTNPFVLDRRDGCQSPEEIVEQLQNIVSDVDAFLSNWLRRPPQCAESFDPTTTADVILQKRFKELQHEKILLEAKRKSDERQLQEKAQQLTQAWLQLEEEQRKFLQMKDPQRPAGHELGLTSSVANRPADATSPAATAVNAPRTELSLSGETVASTQTESVPKAQTRDFAVRQFQQLRREIESSRPTIDRCGETSDPERSLTGDRP